MSNQTYQLIESILVDASMKRCRIHWAKIYAHCKEYIGAQEKQIIRKMADRWGVEIIGK
jgi:hypothetical protein